MSYWNYRVVWHDHEYEPCYGIHEVYYNDDGTPVARTEDVVGTVGETLDEVRDDLERKKGALSKPVLRDADIDFARGFDEDDNSGQS